jgi:hypothetical protein
MRRYPILLPFAYLPPGKLGNNEISPFRAKPSTLGHKGVSLKNFIAHSGPPSEWN